jgi:cell wall-associated NlpC family hydrolase
MRFILAAAGLLFALTTQAAPQPDFGETAFQIEPNLKGPQRQAGQTVAARTSNLVITALGFLDVPYRRGGNTAETGFDCSGFVRAIYDQTLGYLLPRRAEEQAAATQKIDRSQLRPGDLVFFNTIRRHAFSHVGIYIGEDKFIHSPRTGAQVRVESMSGTYWQRRFSGARRVIAAQGDDAAGD